METKSGRAGFRGRGFMGNRRQKDRVQGVPRSRWNKNDRRGEKQIRKEGEQKAGGQGSGGTTVEAEKPQAGRETDQKGGDRRRENSVQRV